MIIDLRGKSAADGRRSVRDELKIDSAVLERGPDGDHRQLGFMHCSRQIGCWKERSAEMTFEQFVEAGFVERQ